MEKTQIIILAGGQGTRMGGDLPKVLTKISDRTLIEYLLQTVENSGINIKPLVVVGFRAELVKKHLKNRVNFAFQKEQLGTGHAVLSAKQFSNKGAKRIMVLYGDMPNISKDAIGGLIRIFNEENPIMAMMTIRVPHFEEKYAGFNGFGRVIRDSGGNIKNIVEFKDATSLERETKELNPSLFCFDADWLWESLPKLQKKNVQGEYYLTDMVGLAIVEGKKVASLEISPEECIGVNTPEDLKRAEALISNSPKFF